MTTTENKAENVVRSAGDHFLERDECFTAIETLCKAAVTDHSGSVVEADAFRPEDALTEKIVQILEKYQEQSHLLDKHLEAMVTQLMDAVKEILQLRSKEREQAGQIDSFPFQVYRNHGLQLVFKCLYTLCKVRGYKAIVKQLPHQVSDLEPTLWLLQCQDTVDYTTWETRYSLLLWMSMLVIIPFDLSSVDSNFNNAQENADSLVATVTELCKRYLSDSGPCREAAAICLARLLTRPDMEAVHLEQFLNWATNALEQIATRRDQKETVATDTFLVTGIFQSLTEIFKHGHREKLVAHIPIIFSRVLSVTKREGQSSLERKLTVKLVQRTGMNFLPPKVVSWRYQRGKRSLMSNVSQVQEDQAIQQAEEEDEDYDVPEEVEDVIETLLGGLRDRDTIVRWSAAKGIGRITSRLPLELADDVVAFVLELFDVSEGDSAWHGGCLALAELARRGLLLPNRLGKVVPLVVDALIYDVRRGPNSVGANVRDAACYVCWAFARAYEPSVMAPHVADLCPQMLVTAVFDREVNCRRAASAAFQENVGRQGHENFPHGIEILTTADYFTLGVRSNAYLQISAFIAQFEHYRKPLIRHLVDKKLAHWDLDLRTLAADALHVLCSSDPSYMANTVLPELIPKTLSPDMLVRHGATLAVGCIVAALAKVPFQLDRAMLSDLRNTIMRIEKARLYRGRGGEWMRVAACKLIQAIAEAGHAMSFRAQKRLLESIEESLKHPKDEVKEAAVEALRALAADYFGPDPTKEDGSDAILLQNEEAPTGRVEASQSFQIPDAGGIAHLTRPVMAYDIQPVREEVIALLVKPHCDKLSQPDPNPAVRRGCALALGGLPAHVLGATPETLALVVKTLIDSSKAESDPELRDAETRRNAVISLGKIVATVGIQVGQSTKCCALSPEQVSNIFSALFEGCEDYEADNRGDVGSWVRAVAIKSILNIASTIRSFPGAMREAERSDGNAAKVKTPAGLASILRRFPGADGPTAYVRVDGDAENNVRKIALPQHSARTLTSSDDDTFVIPAESERSALFVENASDLARSAIEQQRPIQALGSASNSYQDGYLSSQRCCAVINVLLKLLCEKIGILREIAGNALTALLEDADKVSVGMPFIVPHLAFMRQVFLEDSVEHRNWKAETYTFPKIAKVLGLSEYLESSLNGLALSIGDLTESVSRNASDALLIWCKEKKANRSFEELTAVATSLLGMLTSNPKVDRIVVPAMKTLDLLLEQQVLTYQKYPRLQWLLQVHDAIKSEIKGTSNVAKLLAAGKVLFRLASFSAPCNVISLGSVLILLGHKYPNVRMSCAKEFNIWALATDPAEVCGVTESSGEASSASPEGSHGSEPTGNDELKQDDLVEFVREQNRKFERELADRPDAQRPAMTPDFDAEAAFDEVQDIILETMWDKIAVKEARAQRDKLYALLRVPRLITKQSDAHRSDAPQPPKEEESTYADLIHSTEMGY